MRRCPFESCGISIPEDKYACLRHWRSLSPAQKAEIHAAYRGYLADKVSLTELRRRQQAVLDAVQGRNLFPDDVA